MALRIMRVGDAWMDSAWKEVTVVDRKTPMRPVQIDRLCGSSCDGLMIATGESVTEDRWIGEQTFYEHKCNTCGRLEEYEQSFPHIEYEPATCPS